MKPLQFPCCFYYLSLSHEFEDRHECVHAYSVSRTNCHKRTDWQTDRQTEKQTVSNRDLAAVSLFHFCCPARRYVQGNIEKKKESRSTAQQRPRAVFGMETERKRRNALPPSLLESNSFSPSHPHTYVLLPCGWSSYSTAEVAIKVANYNCSGRSK